MDWALEFWFLGDDVLMEISFKSPEDELTENRKKLFKLLKSKGLQYCTPSVSKTHASLKYFQTK